MPKADNKYIIICNKCRENCIRWEIFGLDANGEYYGVKRVLIDDNTVFCRVTGRIRADDYSKISILVGIIVNCNHDYGKIVNKGVIAIGNRGGKSNVYYYPFNERCANESYDEIVEILYPYILGG